jgi:hypothetical protein
MSRHHTQSANEMSRIDQVNYHHDCFNHFVLFISGHVPHIVVQRAVLADVS